MKKMKNKFYFKGHFYCKKNLIGRITYKRNETYDVNKVEELGISYYKVYFGVKPIVLSVERFNKHFTTLTEMRKEKLKKLK
jgi:hypothetical protein